MGNLVSKSNLRNIIKPVVEYVKTLINNVYNSLRDSIAYEKGVIEDEIDDVRSSLAGYVNNGDYNAQDHVIELKNDSTVLATIDATDFIVAGMIESVSVEDVEIEGELVKCLVITFNTEGGGTDMVTIPLTDIFDADAYYTKTQIDNNFVPKTLTITAGTGLTGGGSLTDNITIRLSDGTQVSLAKADTAVQPVDISYMKVIHTNHFNQSLLLRLIEELIEDGEQDMDPEDYQDLTNFMQQFLSQIPAYNTGLIELSRDSEPTILISVYHNNEEQVFEFRWNTAEEPRTFTTYVGLAYQWDSNFENQLPVQSNSQSSTEIWRLEVDSALSSLSRNPVENRVIKNALDGIDTSIGSISQRITEIWDFIGTTSPNDFNDDFNDDFGSSTILDMIADLQDQDISIGDSIQTIVTNIGTINSRITSLENSVNNALANKQDKLTFDTVLDESSTNPVENRAITKALNELEESIIPVDDINPLLNPDALVLHFITGSSVTISKYSYYEYKIRNLSGDSAWQSCTNTINVLEGDYLYLRLISGSNNSTIGTIQVTGQFNLGGNIEALRSSSYKGQAVYQCFKSAFANNTGLLSAKYLKLPQLTSITLGSSSESHHSMFKGCTSLVEAPELPSSSLDIRGYQYMFKGCTSLIKAPELPATVLNNYSYLGMFEGCISLVEAPSVLPVTNISDYYYCYESMFGGCKSLIKGPKIMATVANSRSQFRYMFQGCSSLRYIECLLTTLYPSAMVNWVDGVPSEGVFVTASNVTWASGTNGVPVGWTVLTRTSSTPEESNLGVVNKRIDAFKDSIPKLSVEVIQGDFTNAASRFNLINEAAALVYNNHTLTRCSNAVIGINKSGFPNIFTDMMFIYNVWGYYEYDVDQSSIFDYRLLVLCMDINGTRKLVKYSPGDF